MSLIQQALEKTGKTKPSDISLDTFLKKPTEKLPPKETAETVKIKRSVDSRVRGFKVFLFVLFVLIQAGIVYYFLVLPKLSAAKPVEAETVKKLPSPALELPMQVAVVPTASFIPKPKLKPVFVLTGISKAGNDKFAVINNKVLTVGEEVSKNVTVVDIFPEQKTVTLQDEGREISLRM